MNEPKCLFEFCTEMKSTFGLNDKNGVECDECDVVEKSLF